MGNKRIVSIGTDSRIYHKPGCRYVERIKKRNKLSLPKHDRYKASVARGEKVSRFSNKKYERHAAKVKRRQEIQRVDNLFKMLERQNEGYKELSCH